MKQPKSKWLIAVLFSGILLGSLDGNASCEVGALTDGVATLTKQSGILSHDAYELRSGDKELGKITFRSGLFEKGFSFLGGAEELIATSDQDGLEIGATTKIRDCNKALIGTLEVKRVAGFFTSRLTITVRDQGGNEVAIASEVSAEDDQILFKDPSQANSLFSLTVVKNLFAPNIWKLNVIDSQSIDLRLAVFLLHYRASTN